jgi:hypothetical protein
MSKTNKSFISVEGVDLQARFAAAQIQARAVPRHRYWVAYKFPVRLNVSVDAESMNSVGIGTHVGIILGNVGEHETRSLGVFLFYKERETEASRVELYNLDRDRNYEGWPVYWLGEVEASDSLTLLGSLVRLTKIETVGGKLVDAIAVHESPQVEELLSELTRSSPLVAVRATAVFCLGRFGQNLALVEEVAGNSREDTFVREQAIMAIGKSRTPGTLDALRRLISVVEEQSLREVIVRAIAKSRHPDAVEWLKSFAERTDDPGLRRQAQQAFLKASGEKSRMKEAKRKASDRKDRSCRV